MVPPQVLRLSFFYFAMVFTCGALFGSARIPFLQPTLGARYAELLEMPLMLFVIWESAQLTVSRLGATKQGEERPSTPIWIGTLALVWLVGVELATTAILQGGWWNGVRVYFVGRDLVAGPVYALAVLSYTIMPWYIWLCQRQQAKWTIDFDGSVMEEVQDDGGWF
ncbi:hypothetical protein H2204_004932 [Knufia peltigerae]|uniref:Uncharacterized protein n=1 Tax=Knufia peltigerae TaxID=1002370 RepID=A0AA39D0C6_9EURO|nr:hypothetical protein H2204_004932 [Knufia peltigerae]